MSVSVEQLFTEVGCSVERSDAEAKMRGEAEFAGDVEVPRMLHGKVMRSELPLHCPLPSMYLWNSHPKVVP